MMQTKVKKRVDANTPTDKYDGYTDLLISRNSLRAYIRRNFYLKNILRFVEGKTIDFGCGVGEVLKYLPSGSIGLDPDKTSIKYCQNKNLNVKFYDLNKEKYGLNSLKNQEFDTLLMNHVLEHIDSPKEIMSKILREAKKLNLSRVVVAVPCKKGFKADETHIEYIDNDFFEKEIKTADYRIIHKKYYPINNKIAGNIFRHQELVVAYEIVESALTS
jgi:SAM-dependent methyltransferase